MNQYVSVIIPTYHDWNRLILCIEALRKQTYPEDFFEVIIVNNDPMDTPPDLNLPVNWKLVNESKPGSYAARNAGIRLSKGEILAFTDSDCIPYPNWIEESVKHLNSELNVKRVAGRVELFYKSKNLTPAEIYEMIFGFPQDNYALDGYAATANMIAYKYLFDEIGLFNETMLSGGDTEWGKRAHKKGMKIVYGKDSVVNHPARYKISELIDKGKRTSGGFLVLENISGEKSLWFITGFLPPIIGITKVLKISDLSIKEKVISVLILYYLKLNKTCYKILLKLGLAKPIRT